MALGPEPDPAGPMSPGRATVFSQLQRLVAAIRNGDDAMVESVILSLSQRSRLPGPARPGGRGVRHAVPGGEAAGHQLASDPGPGPAGHADLGRHARPQAPSCSRARASRSSEGRSSSPSSWASPPSPRRPTSSMPCSPSPSPTPSTPISVRPSPGPARHRTHRSRLGIRDRPGPRVRHHGHGPVGPNLVRPHPEHRGGGDDDHLRGRPGPDRSASSPTVPGGTSSPPRPSAGRSGRWSARLPTLLGRVGIILLGIRHVLRASA